MAVTKKNVNGIFYFTYPSSDVFLKERNFFIFDDIKQVYLTGIKIGDKTLNFGGELSTYPFYLDVSAYYAKYNGKFNVTIYFNSEAGLDDSTTITINANTYDCYNPYKELVPKMCGESTYVMITPPFRMLFIDDSSLKINSLFISKNPYRYWEIDGIEYTYAKVMVDIHITKTNFVANQRNKENGSITDSVVRIADLADTSRELVLVNWRTRWGFDVSHLFYLDTYTTEKDDAEEVESEYFYEEHSKHVIKGSFYLDNIKEPYDLWYYKTLANSELVTLTCSKWNSFTPYFMDNGTNAFNGVKITGCNIKDAVVDGVAQSTITFDFEMR